MTFADALRATAALAPLALAYPASSAEFAPPEGFDVEPTEAVVTVAHRGRDLGRFRAMYDAEAGTISFAQPEAVAKAFPDDVDDAALADELAGELSANVDKVCRRVRTDGCGRIDVRPDGAGVIFNRDSWSVKVFPGASLVRETTGPKYVPTPGWGVPGIIQDFYGAASGTANGETERAFSGFSRTVVGDGPARLRARTSLSDADGFALDSAFGEMDNGRWRYGGGLSETTPLPSLGAKRFWGARVETTLETRADLAGAAAGTPVTLFLRERAQVRILRDGRLLEADTYDPGRVRVNTSGLPEGAYDIEIEIRPLAGGAVRTETRFFSKDRGVPPQGEPQYTFEAGFLAPDAGSGVPGVDPVFAHGGGVWRLAEGVGLAADATATSRTGGGEIGLRFVEPWGEVDVSGFATLEIAGASARLFGTSGAWSYSARARHVEAFGDAPEVDAETGAALVERARTRTTFDLGLDWRANADWQLGFDARAERYPDEDVRWNAGPSVSYAFDLGRTRGLARLTGSLDEEGEAVAYLSVSFFASGDRWSASSTSTAQRRDDGTALSSEVDGSYVAWRNATRDLTLNAGARAERDADGENAFGGSLGAEYDGELANAEAEGVKTGNRLSWSATGRTGFAATTEAFALGVVEGESVVAVNSEGRPNDQFGVYVNGRREATMSGDGFALATVDTYETSRVEVRQTDGGSVRMGGGRMEVAAYPGTVRVLEVAAQPVTPAIFRLVDGDAYFTHHDRAVQMMPTTLFTSCRPVCSCHHDQLAVDGSRLRVGVVTVADRCR
ncbi:hypothetical protein CKO28_18565 [Rhodovibrio sodomensis]|uniref:Pilus assembly protein E-set like domain-containing protein n=1 Tax=Rhodovibrio sodomensis TaxID=1088 RepID=A0ABS1DJ59_9PROT|nr:TcfC E-set like domain-containing protein [Rhodovibrio sodomensis]MBK1670041.1 hypothetical protein [Rhodovibrio sodomensis]